MLYYVEILVQVPGGYSSLTRAMIGRCTTTAIPNLPKRRPQSSAYSNILFLFLPNILAFFRKQPRSWPCGWFPCPIMLVTWSQAAAGQIQIEIGNSEEAGWFICFFTMYREDRHVDCGLWANNNMVAGDYVVFCC